MSDELLGCPDIGAMEHALISLCATKVRTRSVDGEWALEHRDRRTGAGADSRDLTYNRIGAPVLIECSASPACDSCESAR